MPGAWVYMMSSRWKPIYVGATTDLLSRVRQHKMRCDPQSFTARYNLTRLVYYEFHPTYEAACACEKQLKGWKRERKVVLIEGANPQWIDLSRRVTAMLMGR
jgi:putative endonuclease